MPEEIQAVLFDNKMFNTRSAARELRKMGVTPMKKVHKTTNKLRYRIQDPKKFTKLRTKSTTKGVEIIVGFT